MDSPLRAAIYVRMSQDRSGEGAGAERQRVDCRALAEQRKYVVCHELVENDTSAYRTSARRPQWRRLVELIKQGEVDVVLAYHTDRLYRHPKDLEEIVDELIPAVRIETVRAGDYDLGTDTGQMIARILGATARQEVARKADRQARALADKAKKGKYHGGRRPLGYEPDGKTIREAEAAVLRTAADMILSGDSLSATTKYVNAALDYPARPRPKKDPDEPDEPAGTYMSPRVLRTALTAPRMVGRRQYLPQVERERAKRLGAAHAAAAMTTTESSDWEGILDVDTWDALRAKFSPDRRMTGHRPPRSLLAGLVHCGHDACIGAPMGHSGRGYQCSSARGGCGRVSIAGAGLEAMVLGMVEARLEASDLGSLAAPEPASEDERQRDELQVKFARLLPLFEEGIVTAEELRTRRVRLAEQIAELDKRLGQRQIRAAEMRRMWETLSVWALAPTPEKATILRALITKVLVMPAERGKGSGPRFDPTRVQVVWARPHEA